MPRKYISTEDVAQVCRRLRERDGLSVSELARRLGVARQYVQQAEDPTKPSVHRIRRLIIEYFGGTYEEIIRVTLP